MKKIRVIFAIAALLVSTVAVFAKSKFATVYYIADWHETGQFGANCDFVISSSQCPEGTGIQCWGSGGFTIEGQYQIVHNLPVSKKVNGGPCEIVRRVN